MIQYIRRFCIIQLLYTDNIIIFLNISHRGRLYIMKLDTRILLCFAVCTVLTHCVYSLKKEDCEVCVAVVDKFSKSLSAEVRTNPKQIETEFRKFCKNSKSKENRFCYYLGGLDESATGILGELSKPLSWSMPAEKVCEKLKKKDGQICDLRYDKTIDLNTVDLKKLKVRDLKRILNDWDDNCDGCIEKTDFIKRIEELKPQFMHQEL